MALDITKIWWILFSNPGKPGVSTRALLLQLTGSEADVLSREGRNLRDCIEMLRAQGWPICSSPHDGYFFAATPEEVSESINLLTSRARHSLWIASKLKRLGMPLVTGQLKFDIDFADPRIPDMQEVHQWLPKGRVSIVAEIPEELNARLTAHVEVSGGDFDQIVAAAINQFLELGGAYGSD